MNVVTGIYSGSKEGVRVNGIVSESLEALQDIGQGCVILPWTLLPCLSHVLLKKRIRDIFDAKFLDVGNAGLKASLYTADAILMYEGLGGYRVNCPDQTMGLERGAK